jgi:ribosomal protein S19
MHRATWKFPFINSDYLDDLDPLSNIDILLRNVNRSIIISENLYKKKVTVYNGKRLIKISIKNSMIGHKFGEFAITKALGARVFTKKKKKKKKK